jgi:choline dehydrogenase-like flavoprotein
MDEPHDDIDPSRLWDVAVIGTGIGGATLAHSLVRRGLSVLLLEKGGTVPTGQPACEARTPQERMAQGWWPEPFTRKLDGADDLDRFLPPLGCAVGGSSIHYAAALERMERSDFDALRTAKQEVPAWPVCFDDFLPWYRAAESLYGLDPADAEKNLSRLSPWNRALMDTLRGNGLKPAQLHVAMRYDEDCRECLGTVCDRGCKADARTTCISIIQSVPTCRLVDHCEVDSLVADRQRVNLIRAIRHAKPMEVRARMVVLSAGAMHSPQILLRSKNESWPTGLGNGSDQVGRNLMFHSVDFYALWSPGPIDRRGRQKKALSIRDFYCRDGQRLGYVQSMGRDAGPGEIAWYVKNVLRSRGLRHELLLKLVAKLPSMAMARLLGDASIFAAMTEDDPDPDNRIVLDPEAPDGASFRYTITDDLRQRARDLRLQFARGVKPWRMVGVSPSLMMNYGHPCGTCRFGDDPVNNVLDRDCRVHELDNLYVVDASFFPRSGAINPSLTIAANALRVAERVAARLT